MGPPGTVRVDKTDGAHSWENVGAQGWEKVAEDEHGNLIDSGGSSSLDIAEIIRRRRRLRARHDAAGGRRVIRDMIRYVYLVLDVSASMGEKDSALPPGTRLNCAVTLATDFVNKFFDENPVSHLGVVIAKDGEAEMLTQLSGNPRLHHRALSKVAAAVGSGAMSCIGDFSLQNALEVAGRSLGHMPRYGSREVVVIFGALSTCDPGDLLVDALSRLQQADIRVSCIALVAEIYVARRLSEETHGSMNVCLDKNHFRDLLMAQCTPPPALPHHKDNGGGDDELGNNGGVKQECDFVQMGFPTRESGAVPSLIHATKDKKLFARTGYLCPRCKAKAYDLPTDCAVCGLKLVLSPHLARSFHHLFPVPPFGEIAPIPDEYYEDDADEGIASEVVSSSGVTKPQTATSSSSSANTRRRRRPCGPSDVDSSILVTSDDCNKSCYACLKYIGPTYHEQERQQSKSSSSSSSRKKNRKQQSAAPVIVTDEATVPLRFRCPDCRSIFCADCDAFLHETLHNCPGCLTKA